MNYPQLEQLKAALPAHCTLMAVSKTRSREEVEAAAAAGIRVFGENKVQELKIKVHENDPFEWHLIGHLQTNKVKDAVRLTSMIHSVDSLHLLEAIDHEAAKQHKQMPILFQINIAAETTKSGFTIQEAEYALTQLDHYPHINVKGIMVIGPNTDDEARIREVFALAKQFYDNHQKQYQFDTLSMGMSHDYSLALEYGSTLIRIGTLIFGERDYH